jgi:hypothetical protein
VQSRSANSHCSWILRHAEEIPSLNVLRSIQHWLGGTTPVSATTPAATPESPSASVLVSDKADVDDICGLPLAKQCEALEFPFSRLHLPGDGSVELRAARHLESQGSPTCHCEGSSVLVMLEAMALPELVKLAAMESP